MGIGFWHKIKPNWEAINTKKTGIGFPFYGIFKSIAIYSNIIKILKTFFCAF
jgi:hypothetical protein